jgi:hypothetical protein
MPIEEDITQQSPRRSSSLAASLPMGNPAGASEARRSVYSKKLLCKRTHHAAMRSHFKEANHRIAAGGKMQKSL